MLIHAQVRQPRLHTIADGLHSNFTDYLDEKGYSEEERAYILDIGAGLIGEANDKFVKMSFPYNKSKDGYGTFVLPRENVMISGDKSKFDEILYDVDLGDRYKKRNVTYIDENGQRCEKLVSTTYIERYLNYTAIAYEDAYQFQRDGRNFGSVRYCRSNGELHSILGDKENECFQRNGLSDVECNVLHGSIILCSHDYLMDYNAENISALKNKYIQFYNEETKSFDYAGFRNEVFPLCEDLVQPSDFRRDVFDEAYLSNSNEPIYLRSYADGINDFIKCGLLKNIYVAYPPEKDSDEYDLACKLEIFKSDADYDWLVRQSKRFKDYEGFEESGGNSGRGDTSPLPFQSEISDSDFMF